MQILKWPWVPLETHRYKYVCKLVKKCLANNVPQFLCNYFTFHRDVVPRITLQSNCPCIQQVRTEAAKITFWLEK